ncbi:hypothetical protein H4219_004920 [Mycoemilia scoparia]|uniref:glucan endo-1,3-beta-D-glucosidase n=1 Tax=Mycoemilia scoparia TaxID=417184 RepID=A0A9W8DQB8_9FUNG|nr:hypothetical protein H4219_004920 [Mycoemilia scoparia]
MKAKFLTILAILQVLGGPAMAQPQKCLAPTNVVSPTGLVPIVPPPSPKPHKKCRAPGNTLVPAPPPSVPTDNNGGNVPPPAYPQPIPTPSPAPAPAPVNPAPQNTPDNNSVVYPSIPPTPPPVSPPSPPTPESPKPQPQPSPEPSPSPAPSSPPTPPSPTPGNPPPVPIGGGSGCLWGLNYSPYNVDGSCPDAGKVAQDLKTIAGVTQKVRLYSTDCNQLDSVLKAVDGGIKLDVYAGIWLSDGPQRFQSDLESFVKAVKPHLSKGYVKGVSVGNEELFKNTINESQLVGYINQVRDRLKAEGINIPVYTTEADAKFTPNLASSCDVIQVNIYSVFDGQYHSIQNSVETIFGRVNQLKSKLSSGSKTIRIGETGWSSNNDGSGVIPCSLELQQQFMNQFVCKANKSGLEYFYFEAKNADWKKSAPSIEKNFGIFDANFSPKFSFADTCQCH